MSTIIPHDVWARIAGVGDRVPHVIHTIWVGPKPPPLVWMKTWAEVNKGWEYKVWDETALRGLGTMMGNRDAYDWFYERGIYYGACDVASPAILASEGGVFVGADAIALRPLGGAPFMRKGFFVAQAREVNRLQNGVWGAVPGHPTLTEFGAALRRLPRSAGGLMPAHVKTGGNLLWDVVIQSLATDIAIVPRCTFFPFDSRGNPAPAEGPVYAEHYWGSTHGLYDPARRPDGYATGGLIERKP